MFARTAVCLPFLAVVSVAGCATAPRMDTVQSSPPRQTILFSITSGTDNPEAAAFALQLAVHALAADRDVVVFFNLTGVQMAVKRLPEQMPMGEQITNSLATLAKDPHATILVCSQCLQSHHISADNLAPGARPATEKSLFSALKPNTVVFTY